MKAEALLFHPEANINVRLASLLLAVNLLIFWINALATVSLNSVWAILDSAISLVFWPTLGAWAVLGLAKLRRLPCIFLIGAAALAVFVMLVMLGVGMLTGELSAQVPTLRETTLGKLTVFALFWINVIVLLHPSTIRCCIFRHLVNKGPGVA